MDNGGENIKLMHRCQSADWKLGIKKFELTARDTPQQNALSEIGFATINNRSRSLMYRANIPIRIRHLLYPKAILLATLMDGLVIEEINGVSKCRVEHVTGRLPDYARGLRTFGEAGVVKLKTKTTPKMLNKGTTCMFVGYPQNHGANCWLMYNPITKGTHVTRDVVWLRRMYYPSPRQPAELAVPRNQIQSLQAGEGIKIEEDDDPYVHAQIDEVEGLPPSPVGEAPDVNTGDNDSDNNNDDDDDDDDIEESKVDEIESPNNPFPRMVAASERANLRRSARQFKKTIRYDPELGNAILTAPEKKYFQALIDYSTEIMTDTEFGCVGAALGGGFENTTELRPMKYQEAMATADKSQWEKAVKEEYDRLVQHKVFKLVPKSLVPKKAKILSSTWAMKKKSNGKFRARVNARGYEQVDGEHYDKDSVASPTINIITVRCILVLMLLMHGYAHLVDVNGAFLLGGWEHDPITDEARKVYLAIPEGIGKFLPPGEWVMLLLKTLYGTKNAAKQFWLYLMNLWYSFNFKYNRADPCLYYKWTDQGIVLWASWVDDCLGIAKNEETLIASKKLLTSKVKCDDTGEKKEYVGCKLKHNRLCRSP